MTSTLPHVTAHPAWIDAARAQWLPRDGHVEPLRVEAYLRSPVAFERDDGLRLDGALSWVTVALTTGLPPPEAFAGVPKGAYVDIPVPIADAVIAGWRVAMCSDAALPLVHAEVSRRRRKKPHPEALGLAKVQTTGGAWKALDIPVAAHVAPVLTWYLVGDRERLETMLRELHAIGRGRAGGLGTVEAWTVTRDEMARERWRERALPVESGVDYGDRVVRQAAVRHAYWHPKTRTLAACPVVAC